MKNPLEKQNNTGLTVAILLGAAAAAAAAYLFLTEDGNDTRSKTKKKLKALAKNKAVKIVSMKTGFPKKAVKAVADHVMK